PGPEADLELRAGLEKEAEEKGTEALHARLKEVDPPSAERIHATDLRRLVRALEVHAITGRPLSEQQTQWTDLEPRHPHRIVALRRPRADLHDRIARRVAAMADEGFVEEVRRLVESPKGLGRTASQAIGYREIAAWIRGEFPDLESALEKTRTRTNRLARMQETWLRRFPGVRFLDVTKDEATNSIANRAHELFVDGAPAG
ncbi:MAG: tRNA dimethylallyltransferase, partial [Planctomycetota bacterium]